MRDPVKIRLIALDCDDTLIVDGEVSSANLIAIQCARQRGANFALITGRPAATTRPIADLVGGAYVLAAYGGYTLDMGGRLLYPPLTIPDLAALALARAIDASGHAARVIIGEIEYFAHSCPQPWEGEAVPSIGWALEHISGPVTEIAVEGVAAVTAVERLCQASYARTLETYAHQSKGEGDADWLTIVASGNNKGQALTLLAGHLGVSRSEVLAVGDSSADVPMFAVAGISVAPLSAQVVAKQAATRTAPEPDAEAVAWAINMFVGPVISAPDAEEIMPGEIMPVDVRDYHAVQLPAAATTGMIYVSRAVAIWFIRASLPVCAFVYAIDSSGNPAPLICYNVYEKQRDENSGEVWPQVMGRLIAAGGGRLVVMDGRDGSSRELAGPLYVACADTRVNGEVMISRHPLQEAGKIRGLYWPNQANVGETGQR